MEFKENLKSLESFTLSFINLSIFKKIHQPESSSRYTLWWKTNLQKSEVISCIFSHMQTEGQIGEELVS